MDRFASIRAGYDGGEVLTRAFTFTGSRLYLNYSTSAPGGIRTEIQDEAGQPLPGFTLADSDLPKVRGTTALAGVGVRFPFLADEVLAFSLKLPADYKLKGLKLRWFFKEALRGFLPDEIITKKKQGFGLPFGLWATKHAGLKALALDSLASLRERGIVRPDFITTLVEKRLPEHPGYYGEMVWILMMLEQWLRGHDSPAPESTAGSAGRP